MRIVVALGGNALLRRGDPLDIETQRHNAGVAADAIAPLVESHEVIVTHGNGPQVGLLALQSLATPEVPAYPLDVLDAESMGMIGYLLERELINRLPDREVLSVLTLVEIDPEDPAFERPTKPIGPWYGKDEWHGIAEARGWSGIEEGGKYRRVVPSPQPLRILEMGAIRRLVDAGVVPICAGGGGVPVMRSAAGSYAGVEAVVDKDRTAALLACALEAERLLLLTDVDAVYRDWGEDNARPLRVIDCREIGELGLPAGSMGPKVEAAARFAQASNETALIGRLEDAVALLAGETGTAVRRAPL